MVYIILLSQSMLVEIVDQIHEQRRVFVGIGFPPLLTALGGYLEIGRRFTVTEHRGIIQLTQIESDIRGEALPQQTLNGFQPVVRGARIGALLAEMGKMAQLMQYGAYRFVHIVGIVLVNQDERIRILRIGEIAAAILVLSTQRPYPDPGVISPCPDRMRTVEIEIGSPMNRISVVRAANSEIGIRQVFPPKVDS